MVYLNTCPDFPFSELGLVLIEGYRDRFVCLFVCLFLFWEIIVYILSYK